MAAIMFLYGAKAESTTVLRFDVQITIFKRRLFAN